MDKECLKRYRANRRELFSLERTLERLYMQLEDVPEVSGKVSKSSDDFPYIEQHVTVQMQEPKKASEIKDRIRKKEKRHKALLADMAEAERIIMKMPEGLSRQILELVYLEGMSQQEVGDIVGYSKGRISQLKSSAVSRYTVRLTSPPSTSSTHLDTACLNSAVSVMSFFSTVIGVDSG